jgi:hypothetical protein
MLVGNLVVAIQNVLVQEQKWVLLPLEGSVRLAVKANTKNYRKVS